MSIFDLHCILPKTILLATRRRSRRGRASRTGQSSSPCEGQLPIVYPEKAPDTFDTDAEKEDTEHTSGKLAFACDVPGGGEEARVDSGPVPEHADCRRCPSEERGRRQDVNGSQPTIGGLE